MNIKTRGVILSRRNYREREKFLTILSEDHGLLECKLRVFGQINQQAYNNIGVMGFYDFDLFVLKQRYTVNAAEKIEDFYPLRLDACKLALGEYFCELMEWLRPDVKLAKANMQLLLNTLHLLAEGKRDSTFLKAVFEWRCLCNTGFMPNLLGCSECGVYQEEKMYFLPLEGGLRCGHCMAKQPRDGGIMLSPDMLQALRFIALKEDREIYSFSIRDSAMERLGQVTEQYTEVKAEKVFKTLHIYRQMVAFG